MFVGKNFKEDLSSEINPIETFGTKEWGEVWNGLVANLDPYLIRDFELTIWYKVSGKIHGSVFFYEVNEVNKAYERVKSIYEGDLVKVLKIELTPRLKSAFVTLKLTTLNRGHHD